MEFHNDYVGAESCKECHADAYNEWKESDHFYAMQPADSISVKAHFNTSFKADNISYSFSIRDQKYFVEVKENGDAQEYEVVYTFGHKPLQQYLIQTSNGKFQTMRASWDVDTEKWFHQSEGNIIEPHDWLSWSKGGQNWNTMCSSCHSTHVKKNYDVSTDSFQTTYKEVNVACESCHGPGSGHIQSRKENGASDPYAKLNLLDQKTQINTCGTCHARRTMLEDSGDPHKEFLNRYFPQTLNSAFYESDGQILEEDFVYGSFLSSKMYRNHVKCSDCHKSHSGKLKEKGNQLCLQCHESSYASKTHHHHDGMSKGAQCVSCHMDGKTYMGNDYRRDHSFRIPRPDQSMKYGTSNACNSCHKDQSSKWAASKVEEWFGTDRMYHFSDDLIPGSQLDENAFQHLKNLMVNDSISGIVKATAIDYLQYLSNPEAGQLILKSSANPDPLIRQNAYSVMVHFPNEIKESYAIKGLSDKIKAVRLMAFRCVIGIGQINLSSKNLKSWNKVQVEYLIYLKANADFPSGQVMIGEYYQLRKDFSKSVSAFKRALKMDSLMVSPYTNLAILYSGKNDLIQVQSILYSGLKHFPDHPEMNYYMGLNEGALSQGASQIVYLEKAYKLQPNNLRYAYNYILTLYQSGQKEKAKSELAEALKTQPNNSRLLELNTYFTHN
jgi:predicted CXXCH cytochrome family protein